MIFFRQQRLLRLERKMKKEKRVGEAHLQENAPNHLERKRAKKTQTCHHLQRRTPSLRGEEMWRIHSKALVILTVFQIFVASIRNSQVLGCFLFARTCWPHWPVCKCNGSVLPNWQSCFWLTCSSFKSQFGKKQLSVLQHLCITKKLLQTKTIAS